VATDGREIVNRDAGAGEGILLLLQHVLDTVSGVAKALEVPPVLEARVQKGWASRRGG